MKNILLPISFSETSRNALHYANLIAKEYGSTINLVHCYSGYEYNREYDFGELDYDVGIKQKLIEFYTKNIESKDKQPFRVIAQEGPISEYLSAISHKYGLLVLSKRTGYLSKYNRWFGDKLFYLTARSNCPVLILSSKRDVFSFSAVKNIWHLQKKDTELDLIKSYLLKLKIESSMIVSKLLNQKSFSSVFWQDIVNYTKTHDESQLKKIHESYSNENIDLLIIVNHRIGIFEKYLKDDTFQIISQLDIPILVLQSKEK